MALYCFRRLSVEDQHTSDSQSQGAREQWRHHSWAWGTPTGAWPSPVWARLRCQLLTPSNVTCAPPEANWVHAVTSTFLRTSNPSQSENCPSCTLAYPSSALHFHPFPHMPLLFPQTCSYPHPGSSSKLCSCVIAQPWSQPWNAARVKFSQDPPGWSLFTCPACSHSCLCRHGVSPAAPRLGSIRSSHLQLRGNSFFKWGKNDHWEFYQLSLSLWLFLTLNVPIKLPNSWTPTKEHLSVNEDFSALDRIYNHIW